MKNDWLIVGSGFTGSVLAERIASQLGERVLLVERRNHIGGNAYDYTDEDGILVHKYGAHAFHTNSKEVWDYLSSFTRWRSYRHRVLALVDGIKIPLPFNLNSIEMLFPAAEARRLEQLLTSEYGPGARVPILQLKAHPDENIRSFADYVYRKVFYGYTMKQWGMPPEQLDSAVTGRVPVCVGRDNFYFSDRYQGMPDPSYSALFQRMLSHPQIEVRLGADGRDFFGRETFKGVIWTGAIDAFFDYRHGPLPYRSLAFRDQTLPQEYFQEVAVVNDPGDAPHTRILEHKHFSGQRLPRTRITYEHPMEYQADRNEPYYPVPKEKNRLLYQKYRQEADQLKQKLWFLGRLGEYAYHNMDEAVSRALSFFAEISG